MLKRVAINRDVFAHEFLFLSLLKVMTNFLDLGVWGIEAFEVLEMFPLSIFSDSLMPFTFSHSTKVRLSIAATSEEKLVLVNLSFLIQRILLFLI